MDNKKEYKKKTLKNQQQQATVDGLLAQGVTRRSEKAKDEA
jgi:hypothetical protein